MKIGFVLDDRLDKPDGVQQYVKLVGSWLSGRGHEVHYLVGDSPNASQTNVHHLSRTVGVKFNKNRMAIPLPASKKQINEVLKREHFDVLHVQMPYSPHLAGRVVRAAEPQTAVVGTFHILPHGTLSSAGTRALGAYLRRTNKRFDRFISVSEAARIFARSHFGINSVVLPNVVEMTTYKKGRPLARYSDRQNIVFLGRLVNRKGAPYLLKAYSSLLEAHPEMAKTTRLIVCGDGAERAQLEQTVAVITQKYGAEIIFTGFLDETDKPHYLASATVAVFPSTGGESFGIVLIEAMAAAAGVVLGGDNPGYSSVLGPINGTLIDPYNARSFAARLYAILSDSKEFKRIHEAQYELVKQFDIAVVGPKIEALYTTVLAARPHSIDN